jgi:2,4-dienoyl-CoA reductase-like NADH-dependent reductase (Old Yellow Enzyme family)
LLIATHDQVIMNCLEGDYYATAPVLTPAGLSKPGRTLGLPATREDLYAVKDAFVRSARIAKRVGADGLEIRACHGYLLDQFLWAGTNLRQDEYGGPDMANRVRFPLEVVQAVRGEVGTDFVISLRFSQWKMQDYSTRSAASPAEREVMLKGMRSRGWYASTIFSSLFARPPTGNL